MQDSAFWAQQHQATVQQDAARRRATKPTDLDLPEGSLELAADVAVTYNNLRAHEKRIDAFMTRKMMEYQDRVLANVKHRRRCRLWIWVEVENQPWQLENEGANFGFGPSKDATYSVYIVGKKIPEPWDKRDDSNDDGVNEVTGKPNNPYKFVPDEKLASTFFRSISVEYERGQTNPEEYPTFGWNKPSIPPNATALGKDVNFSKWRFTRKSDENLLTTLHFLRDEHPERYNLSKELQYVVDELDATKSEIISRIADYVKYKKLQEDDDKRTIRCDEHLKDVSSYDT
jgi:SWI/SNF-related matrix-associated actin-dependent regulator of chromatin subfamily D